MCGGGSTERTQGRKNTSNACTSPSCYCEAPSRLTQAVAASKPERMQIYPPTAEFASKNLRPSSVRKTTASHRLEPVICTSKNALRTQHQVSWNTCQSVPAPDFQSGERVFKPAHADTLAPEPSLSRSAPLIFERQFRILSELSLRNPVRLHLTKTEWTKALIPSRAFGGTPGLLCPSPQPAWQLPSRDGFAPAVAR
jgi:hypothetical protein